MEQAARARQARVDMSNATNPDFGLSKDALSLTYGESAAYIIVFGNKTSGIVNKSWVEYFFREFPTFSLFLYYFKLVTYNFLMEQSLSDSQ